MRKPIRPLAKLQNKFQTSRLQNFINKVNRVRKSKVTALTSKTAKKPKTQSAVNQAALFKRAKVGIIVVLVVIVGAIGLVIWKIFAGINLAPSVLASESVPSPIIGDQVNILLVGYDTNDRYSFVDFLAVFSLNVREGKQRIILINPDFTTTYVDGKQVKYSNVLSNALVKEKPPLDTLERSVEIMLGINIDRYVTVEISSLPSLIESLGINYTTTEAVLDDDAGEYREGQQISDQSLIKYLAADEPGPNTKMLRLAKFLKTELEANASPWRYIGFALNPERWSPLIATDISKLELLNWALSIQGSLQVQYLYLGTSDAQFYPDLTGGYYVPVTLEIDQKIQDSFARHSVIKEQGRIEIYNATFTAGLANVTKRFLSNQGATVIRTGNYTDKEERSKLFVPDPEQFINSVSLIKEIMRGEVIVVNEEYPFNHTGDMVLVVGEDALE
jgi:hypothetical protein